MSRYVVATWRERLAWFVAPKWCAVAGHRPRPKFTGAICDRCRVVLGEM